MRTAHHPTSHEDSSAPYARVTRYYVGQLAHLATRLSQMLDNSCLMFISNLWSGSAHDSRKVPLAIGGGLHGTLQTGRVLDYLNCGDENHKLCSLYVPLMNRMGVRGERFGDATGSWRICGRIDSVQNMITSPSSTPRRR